MGLPAPSRWNPTLKSSGMTKLWWYRQSPLSSCRKAQRICPLCIFLSTWRRWRPPRWSVSTSEALWNKSYLESKTKKMVKTPERPARAPLIPRRTKMHRSRRRRPAETPSLRRKSRISSTKRTRRRSQKSRLEWDRHKIEWWTSKEASSSLFSPAPFCSLQSWSSASWPLSSGLAFHRMDFQDPTMTYSKMFRFIFRTRHGTRPRGPADCQWERFQICFLTKRTISKAFRIFSMTQLLDVLWIPPELDTSKRHRNGSKIRIHFTQPS